MPWRRYPNCLPRDLRVSALFKFLGLDPRILHQTVEILALDSRFFRSPADISVVLLQQHLHVLPMEDFQHAIFGFFKRKLGDFGIEFGKQRFVGGIQKKVVGFEDCRRGRR